MHMRTEAGILLLEKKITRRSVDKKSPSYFVPLFETKQLVKMN